MKKLVDTLKSCRVALGLTFTFAALFLAGSGLAFSQITFEKIWEADFTKPDKLIKDPCFSKDGKYIYFAGGGTILKYDAQTGQYLSSFDRSSFPNMKGTSNLAISSTGTFLLTQDDATGLYLWDTKTERALRFIYQTGAGLIITPDERYHIYEIAEPYVPNTPPLSENSNIYIYDLEKDMIIRKIPAWGHNSLLALSSDGKYLATVAFKNDSSGGNGFKARQKVLLWNTETWIPNVIDSILQEDGARLEAGFNLGFSPNNKFLAWTYTYKSWDQSRIKIYDIEKKATMSLSDSTRSAYCAIFLPDSQTYGFCYPQAEFFDITTNKPKGVLDYSIYQWATNTKENILLGYSFNNGALFKIKNKSLLEERDEKMISATYKEKELKIQVDVPSFLITSISIYDLQGKLIYNSRKLFQDSPKITLPIYLFPGIYLIHVEIDSKEYSTKLEVTR